MQSGERFKVKTTLDLKKVVFDGDMKLRNELAAVERQLEKTPLPDIGGELPPELLMSMPPPHVSAREDLIKTSFRLSRGLAPMVWKALDRCTEFLGITQPIEVYVTPSPESNAFVIPPEKGRVVMGITSSAIERLDYLEMVSVVGHELGHVIFEHHKVGAAIDQQDMRLSPADAMRLFAWMRYAELSADRVGLLCCDDFDACISAEFKLVSGLCHPKDIGDLREVARQFTSLTKEKLEESELDWLATHPYAPLRIRALGLFWQSTTYAGLQGRSGGEVNEREMEKEVETMMALMNPSCLDEKAPNREEIKEFLTLAGLAVAMADKRLDDLEMKALSRMVGDKGLTPAIDDDLRRSRKARNARLQELGDRVRQHTSVLRRRKIVEDLCAIAHADHEIVDSELTTLMSLAVMLGVDPLDVNASLARAEAPLD